MFWTKIFLGPKNFGPKTFFDQKVFQNFLKQKYWWGDIFLNKIFSDQNYFSDQNNFFRPTFFWIFFGAKQIFGLTFFLVSKFFGIQNCLWPGFFWDKNFFQQNFLKSF